MGWFLDHAWLVPLIPAVSFVVILLFGRRMPRQGSEVGIAAIGASFLLSCGAAVGWIRHLRNAEPGTSALGALGLQAGCFFVQTACFAFEQERGAAV